MKKIQTCYDGIESVEIPLISTTDAKYYFPAIPALKGKILRRIEFPHDVTTTPNNRLILASNNFRSAYLTLVSDKKTILHRLPFILIMKYYEGSFEGTDFLDIEIEDMEQSYIEFSNSATLAITQSIFLNFYYTEKPKAINKPKNLFLKTDLMNNLMERDQPIKIYPLSLEITDITKKEIYFPDDNFLKGKRIAAIECYCDSSIVAVTTPKNPANKSFISDTIYKKSYLVLEQTNRKKINLLPISLIAFETSYDKQIFFNDLQINWPKSYIKIANTTGLTINTIFYLLIHYYDAVNV